MSTTLKIFLCRTWVSIGFFGACTSSGPSAYVPNLASSHSDKTLLRIGVLAAGTQTYRLDTSCNSLVRGTQYMSKTPVVSWGASGPWAMVAPIDQSMSHLQIASISAAHFVWAKATQLTYPPTTAEGLSTKLDQDYANTYQASTVYASDVYALDDGTLKRINDSHSEILVHVRSRGWMGNHLVVDLGGGEVGLVPQNGVSTPGPWVGSVLPLERDYNRGSYDGNLLHYEVGYPTGHTPATAEVCTSETPSQDVAPQKAPLSLARSLLLSIDPHIRQSLQPYWTQTLEQTALGKSLLSAGTRVGVDFSSLDAEPSANSSNAFQVNTEKLKALPYEATWRQVFELLNAAADEYKKEAFSNPSYHFFLTRSDDQTPARRRYQAVVFNARQSIAEQFSRPQGFSFVGPLLDGQVMYYLNLDLAYIFDVWVQQLDTLEAEGVHIARPMLHKKTLRRRLQTGFLDPRWYYLFKSELVRQFATHTLALEYELVTREYLKNGQNIFEYHISPGTAVEAAQGHAATIWANFVNKIRTWGNYTQEIRPLLLRGQPGEFIAEVRRLADEFTPGLGAHVGWSLKANGRYLLSLDLDGIVQAGLDKKLHERNRQEVRQEAARVWNILVDRAKHRMALPYLVSAGAIGEPQLFLELLRELSEAQHPGLGNKLDMCWMDYYYGVRFYPIPDLSELPP